MSKIERIEQEIQALSPEELAQFRAWFLEYDWANWDRPIERDAEAGRLDDLAARALRDHAAGKTMPIWSITLPRTSGRCTERCRSRFGISRIKRTLA